MSTIYFHDEISVTTKLLIIVRLVPISFSYAFILRKGLGCSVDNVIGNSLAWQQHDIQELCRVMFDALEKKFENTDQAKLISLYEGNRTFLTVKWLNRSKLCVEI